MSWFGSLDLAWKYTLVFGSLLFVTILAGIIKVFYNRRRVNKFAKEKADLEAGRGEDVQELNQREKDEGDLFGIRAIEAGFFAGIPQSRPTSSAGVTLAGTPNMSTNTLVGSLSSPKIQSHSVSSSITTLPPAHLKSRETSTDSDLLGLSLKKPRRKTPPTLKLQPSEAEINGRLNHNAELNMNLNVPASSNTLPQPPKSPVISIHDYDAPDSPPRSPAKLDHYVPAAPPQLSLPDGLRASIFSTKSQTPSYYIPTPGGSPGHSAPTSPRSPSFAPQTRVPSMAPSGLGDEPPRSPRTPGSPLFPVYYEESRPSLDGEMGESSYYGNDTQLRPSSPVRLQPLTYQPTHRRDPSESSMYSERRLTYPRNRSGSTESNASLNYSLPYNSRQSMSQRRMSTSSYLQTPVSGQSSNADSRLSDFYDAYYRQSTLVVAQKSEGKRPNQLSLAPPTIVEVPTPVGSPMPPQSPASPRDGSFQPGVAL